MDEFARNICSGLEFRGVVYEGSNLALERALPLGGVDVLDEAVYWLFPRDAASLRETSTEAELLSARLAGQRIGWLASWIPKRGPHWLAGLLASSLEKYLGRQVGSCVAL